MTLRLYMDEDALSKALVQALRSQDVDIITTNEVGQAGCSDEEQLEYATSQGRVIYSYNVGDFYELHTAYLMQGISHAGIILAPQDSYSVGEQLRRLLKLIGAVSKERMRDQVVFLSAWGEA